MISDAIKKMQAMARKAQEETYDGTCTVTEFQPIKDPRTKITSEKEVVVLEDEPCRLSYSNVSAVDQTETAAKTAQVTKLFLSPDTQIKYECSGVPAVYPTHQEIVLILSERYA